MLYGFNSRMLPDSVQMSKPVFRVLASRTGDELEILEKIRQKLEKKRKSRTLEAKGKKSPIISKPSDTKAVSDLEPEVVDNEG